MNESGRVSIVEVRREWLARFWPLINYLKTRGIDGERSNYNPAPDGLLADCVERVVKDGARNKDEPWWIGSCVDLLVKWYSAGQHAELLEQARQLESRGQQAYEADAPLRAAIEGLGSLIEARADAERATYLPALAPPLLELLRELESTAQQQVKQRLEEWEESRKRSEDFPGRSVWRSSFAAAAKEALAERSAAELKELAAEIKGIQKAASDAWLAVEQKRKAEADRIAVEERLEQEKEAKKRGRKRKKEEKERRIESVADRGEIKQAALNRIDQRRIRKEVAQLRERFRPQPAASFVASDLATREWLVEGVIVPGEPLLLGGPKKTLKTSIAIDLAISIASGAPFLGRFAVPKPRSVVIYSGESGAATLQDAVRRIAAARGVDVAGLQLAIQTQLPRIAVPEQLEALRLEAEPFEVVILDPCYRTLGAGANTANLAAMGDTLGNLADKLGGKTVVLLHHTTKDCWPGRLLDLSDLAFAGVQEFARQWLLVNRRTRFKPDGETAVHRLAVSYGGSAGHSGAFALDVDEGKLLSDFSGRQWQTSVTPWEEAKRQKRPGSDPDKARERLAGLLQSLPADGSPLTVNKLRTALGKSGTSAAQLIDNAAELGYVERKTAGRSQLVSLTPAGRLVRSDAASGANPRRSPK